MRDVGNFEGKVMDTYYETQFKKKDPNIKFWGKTNDRDWFRFAIPAEAARG